MCTSLEQESVRVSLGIQSDQPPKNQCYATGSSQSSEHQCGMSGGISMQINAEYEGLKKGKLIFFITQGCLAGHVNVTASWQNALSQDRFSFVSLTTLK